jgi:hypothetical protein
MRPFHSRRLHVVLGLTGTLLLLVWSTGLGPRAFPDLAAHSEAALVRFPALVAVAPAPAALAALPARWPSTLQLGMADSPGGAAAMKAMAPLGFRYQYLSGGANTGGGWATWNPNGDFVTYYIQDSVANGIVPVFTYYQVLQSAGPCSTCAESDKDLAHLNDTATMTAVYNDLKLFYQRAAAFPNNLVVLQVEPDLWGFSQQKATADDAKTVPAKVAATGLAELAGLPDNAAGFAQAVRKLRDTYAPKVLLGYHLSIWGTGTDIQVSKPSLTQTDSLATRSATFYRSLGADFDVAFGEFSDRDAGFYQYQYNDGGVRWMTADDFTRHVRYLSTFSSASGKRIVLWQIPYGNTKMQAQNNTWDHYQDNRVEWLLDDATRAHLNDYLQAGVVALLFGQGADGTTCPCDAAKDGVTNPVPINGNTGVSLTADDDGGFFRQKAAAYYSTGAMSLPTSSSASTSTPVATAAASSSSTPTAQPSFTTSASAAPSGVSPGGTVTVTASVTSATAATVLVDVEGYSPSGGKVFQQSFDNESFTAGQTKSYPVSWAVPATAATGTYTVKVGIFAPAWGTLYSWNDNAAQFAVTAATATPTSGSSTSTPTSGPTATATVALSPTSTPMTGALAPSTTSTPPLPTSTPTAPRTPTTTATPTPRPSATPCPTRGKCR